MCEFFSAIGLQSGAILWNEFLDSHSELIACFGMARAENSETQHFVKLEFTGDLDEDTAGWTLRIDEDRTPHWCDAEMRERFRRECAAAVTRILAPPSGSLIAGRRIVRLVGWEGRVKRSCINSHEDSTVAAYEGSTVTAYEGSTVTAHEGSTVIKAE